MSEIIISAGPASATFTTYPASALPPRAQVVGTEHLHHIVQPLLEELASKEAALATSPDPDKAEALQEAQMSFVAADNRITALENEVNTLQHELDETKAARNRFQSGAEFNAQQLENFKEEVRDALIEELQGSNEDKLKSLIDALDLPKLRRTYKLTKTITIEVEVQVDSDYDGDGTDLVDTTGIEVETTTYGDRYDAETDNDCIEEGGWVAEEL